jgi:hypothetical protein
LHSFCHWQKNDQLGKHLLSKGGIQGGHNHMFGVLIAQNEIDREGQIGKELAFIDAHHIDATAAQLAKHIN